MLIYEVTPLPPVWPGGRTAEPRPSPFRVVWSKALDHLEREIDQLKGHDVALAVDVANVRRDLNNNGTLRADANVLSPRIILSFTAGDSRLSFPCDTYKDAKLMQPWQANVYAVALTLERLRDIERYGASSLKQYEGFKALPASTAPKMTAEDAAIALEEYANGISAHRILFDKDAAKLAARGARASTHPDRNGGDGRWWNRAQAAVSVLSSHHGVSL